MTLDLRLLVYAAILTWLMLLVASLMRSRAWTPAGLKLAFGNRADLPAPSPAAARAERAARNMLENLVLFVAILVAAHASHAPQARLDLGARVFFYARLAYIPIYLAGLAYVRTLVWSVSVAGLAILIVAAL